MFAWQSCHFLPYIFHLSKLKKLIHIFVRANMTMLAALQKREIQNSRNMIFNLFLKKLYRSRDRYLFHDLMVDFFKDFLTVYTIFKNIFVLI